MYSIVLYCRRSSCLLSRYLDLLPNCTFQTDPFKIEILLHSTRFLLIEDFGQRGYVTTRACLVSSNNDSECLNALTLSLVRRAVRPKVWRNIYV